jgi:hypothetical protein
VEMTAFYEGRRDVFLEINSYLHMSEQRVRSLRDSEAQHG